MNFKTFLPAIQNNFFTHQYNQNYHGNLIKFKLKKKTFPNMNKNSVLEFQIVQLNLETRNMFMYGGIIFVSK